MQSRSPNSYSFLSSAFVALSSSALYWDKFSDHFNHVQAIIWSLAYDFSHFCVPCCCVFAGLVTHQLWVWQLQKLSFRLHWTKLSILLNLFKLFGALSDYFLATTSYQNLNGSSKKYPDVFLSFPHCHVLPSLTHRQLPNKHIYFKTNAWQTCHCLVHASACGSKMLMS